MKKHLKWLIPVVFGVAAVSVAIVIFLQWKKNQSEKEVVELPRVDLLYGIDISPYTIDEGVIQNGQTAGQIFAGYGVGAVMVDRISKQADSIFKLRDIRAGHKYTAFMTSDSLPKLDYFFYEISNIKFLEIDLRADSVRLALREKQVETERFNKTGRISSSLWNAMVENEMSPALAMELSDMYAWTIDFFALQKDDEFTVIFDQQYVDSVSVGVGRIWGAKFVHAGKAYYAIPFIQDGKLRYWDEQGNSLRKNLLKAPLDFFRITSKFSNSRLHPVLRIRRPHHGVDYAAPSGTPVRAVGDGVVISKGWAGGGGNTLKIKHNHGGLVSGYLHLKGFAKGINNGSRVHQGQIIGYVGSTGLSTGPHLDFRLWQNNKAIDPLKVPTEPAEPISPANKAAFEEVRKRVLAELAGELTDLNFRITEELINPAIVTPAYAGFRDTLP